MKIDILIELNDNDMKNNENLIKRSAEVKCLPEPNPLIILPKLNGNSIEPYDNEKNNHHYWAIWHELDGDKNDITLSIVFCTCNFNNDKKTLLNQGFVPTD